MLRHNPGIATVLTGGIMAMLLLAPAMASAACTVAAGGLSFGSYDVFNGSHTDSTGSIDISCDTATPYTLTLSPGNGSYTQRTMVNGSHVLNYNFYSDAARSQIWGDGSGGTVSVSGNAETNANHTVYGRIQAQQNVSVGSYVDSIIVTLEY